jgi:hypothetical protein
LRIDALAHWIKPRWSVAVIVASAAVMVTPAHAGGPSMVVGVTEDAFQQPTLVAAKAKIDLAQLVGFNAIRLSATWSPGEDKPTAGQLTLLGNAAEAANIAGMDVYISIYPFGSSVTPVGSDAQNQFANYAAALAHALPTVQHYIIGNEPNTNRFWLPQFDASGGDAAAASYESLLALTYDALKSISPQILVIGGAVGPRGGDVPGTGRDTHSPTAFIADMAAAYKASGRTNPIMDAFAIHPYEDNSSLAPTFAHPRSTTIALADYGKLVTALSAFDGTGQPGSTLPIYYGEFGVETQIPAAKASLYTGTEPATTKPVDEATQGAYYRQALELAFCQPNVAGIFLFHLIDEKPLDRWQSGVYYADGAAKSSLPVVRAAVAASLGGTIARCPGLALTPKPTTLRFPDQAGVRATPRLGFVVGCDIDCNYRARVERLPAHSTTLEVSGRLPAGQASIVQFPQRRLARGQYRFTVRLTAPVNTGTPWTGASAPFRLP